MAQGADTRIIPVILSGGAGTRLWPLSRELYPKQMLPLIGEDSLLQDTARRVADGERFGPPIVVCNESHRFLVAEQLRGAAIEPAAIVLEPAGRNTAPAAAVAAHLACREDEDALILVLPSDHNMTRPEALTDAVARGRTEAAAGALVTFGIIPESPETGYGYLRRGPAVAGADGVYRLDRFVEKPDLEAAEAMLAEGGHLWNAGIFLFPARRYLNELARLEPAIAAAAAAAIDGAQADIDFLRLEPTAFLAGPAKSIDYAVMEHVAKAVVVEADLGWSDLGAWSSLWQLGDKDGDGNVLIGDVLAEDTADSYVRTTGRLVATVGVRDMVVVATDDAILVVAMDRAQDVRTVVTRLKQAERSESDLHSRVYRPWGYYQGVDIGANFQVKRIAVYPGRSLSLQKHAHRAEHWVVVDGTAIVTRDDETFELGRNQSTYIPVGAVHRLENRGPGLLKLIEVQSGDYLGEDDIMRLEDDYGRA